MFSIILDHLQYEDRKCFSLLVDIVNFKHSVGQNEKSLNKHFLAFDRKKKYIFENWYNIIEQIKYNNYLVVLSKVGDEMNLLFGSRKKKILITWWKGIKKTEKIIKNGKIIAEIDFVDERIHAIFHFKFNILISVNAKAYQDIGEFYNRTADEGPYDPDQDMFFDGDGVKYKLPITFDDVDLDEEYIERKLLEGVFIDPYINDKGEQDFRCIVRPDKPFCDAEGKPISKVKRIELKELLDIYLNNPRVISVTGLLNF